MRWPPPTSFLLLDINQISRYGHGVETLSSCHCIEGACHVFGPRSRLHTREPRMSVPNQSETDQFNCQRQISVHGSTRRTELVALPGVRIPSELLSDKHAWNPQQRDTLGCFPKQPLCKGSQSQKQIVPTFNGWSMTFEQSPLAPTKPITYASQSHAWTCEELSRLGLPERGTSTFNPCGYETPWAFL